MYSYEVPTVFILTDASNHYLSVQYLNRRREHISFKISKKTKKNKVLLDENLLALYFFPVLFLL